MKQQILALRAHERSCLALQKMQKVQQCINGQCLQYGAENYSVSVCRPLVCASLGWVVVLHLETHLKGCGCARDCREIQVQRGINAAPSSVVWRSLVHRQPSIEVISCVFRHCQLPYVPLVAFAGKKERTISFLAAFHSDKHLSNN